MGHGEDKIAIRIPYRKDLYIPRAEEEKLGKNYNKPNQGKFSLFKVPQELGNHGLLNTS